MDRVFFMHSAKQYQQSSFELITTNKYNPPELSKGFNILTCAAFLGHIGVIKSTLVDLKWHQGDGTVQWISLDGMDHQGINALYAATVGNQPVVVMLLLRWKANASLLCSKTRLTPLMVAAFFGYDNILKLLLYHQPECRHVMSPCGVTALYSAAKQGHTECVRILLRYDDMIPHIWKRCVNGRNPLEAATRYGHTDVVDLLLYHVVTLVAQNDKDADGVVCKTEELSQ